jgi:hypothetical protein
MLGLMGSLLTLRWRIASIVAVRNAMSADTLETLTMSFSRLDQDWWQICCERPQDKENEVSHRYTSIVPMQDESRAMVGERQGKEDIYPKSWTKKPYSQPWQHDPTAVATGSNLAHNIK